MGSKEFRYFRINLILSLLSPDYIIIITVSTLPLFIHLVIVIESNDTFLLSLGPS